MPEPLTDAQLAELERTLRAQRLALDAEQARLAGTLDEVRAARNGSDADDEHDPEGPTLSSEWSRLSGLTADFAVGSAALDRAASRIGAGSYGACIRCGQPGGFDRLDALPAAELCITCARLA
ncbi:TraR/DksA family transcriptional regulator [Subtercola lobariae]|uniref:DnaK suppressor protein n=1 Tax=Subtercola lobariae TaxID=1588641 RepID=A0A917BCM6_9MICO|nr:TraR/DksA C4-type zinc finger protein [Subtercola lobariae]GGF35816.1 DnaK suppressor protein [Subtercola lobariae]